jgi:hypothetical protein
MRSAVYKLLTCSLLATYVGISVLGQGLHLLTPDHGHHHHGLQVVTCTAHGHCHGGTCCANHPHSEHADHEDRNHAPAGQIVTAGGASDSHNCEICEFLFQAVSQPPLIAAVPDLHSLVAVAALPHHEIYSSAILGLHAARGPPQLLA